MVFTIENRRAQLEIAQIRLQRCEVRAPFDGRVKAVTLEAGQYVTPGQNVITLADDALLEIHVSLDSRDARKWLRFGDNPSLTKTAWFARPEPVICKIRWTENREGHFWEGRLNRVVKFDKQNYAGCGNCLPRGFFVGMFIPASGASESFAGSEQRSAR
ncbi:HlyD family efflux transporter periplasmic adaptor subunit [Desulfococcaceae bacterium HSG9]|nr:HlyD family efflux transporter periplasmic adaptor subunit [Desulfococcaceae bacterium HSG9]